MSVEKAMKLFESLARSQGYYGRLLRDLRDHEEMRLSLKEWCDKHPNADDLDLILAIEG